jgi:2-dehydropantoate 2-reductase
VASVARAQGVGLTEEDVESALAFVQGMPATWRASLAVDLEQGRRLEIDGLAGAVVRRGQTAGIETPFHRVALGVLKPHAAGAV